MKVDIGIIGAMDIEVNNLISMLDGHTEEKQAESTDHF